MAIVRLSNGCCDNTFDCINCVCCGVGVDGTHGFPDCSAHCIVGNACDQYIGDCTGATCPPAYAICPINSATVTTQVTTTVTGDATSTTDQTSTTNQPTVVTPTSATTKVCKRAPRQCIPNEGECRKECQAQVAICRNTLGFSPSSGNGAYAHTDYFDSCRTVGIRNSCFYTTEKQQQRCIVEVKQGCQSDAQDICFKCCEQNKCPPNMC